MRMFLATRSRLARRLKKALSELKQTRAENAELRKQVKQWRRRFDELHVAQNGID